MVHAAGHLDGRTGRGTGGSRRHHRDRDHGITPVSRGVTNPATGLPTGCGAAANPCDSEVVATATVAFQTFFPVLIPQLQTVTMTQTARMRFEGG